MNEFHLDDRDYRQELHNYFIGFGLALGLTLVAFAIVVLDLLGSGATLIVLGILGIVQFAVQLRYFLHIDLSRQKREDLQLILFTILLLSIMALGTIWILGNLADRMMMM